MRNLLFALPFLAASPVLAQPAGVDPWFPRVTGLAAAMGETDIDQGGSLSMQRWYLDGGLNFALSRRHSYGAAVGIGKTHYDFDTAAQTSDLDIRELSLSLPIRLPLGESGAAFIIPRFQFAGEDGVSLGDGTTYGLIAGAAWKVSPSLRIGPGFGAFSALGDEDDGEIFPILLIDWQIAERWALSTGQGIAATRGPGLTLTYQASDAFAVGLGARYESFSFRLDEDAEVPDGIGIDRSVPVVLTADWTPRKGTRLTGFAGMAYGGELEFQNEKGEKIVKRDYDPAPIFGLALSVDF